MPNKGSSLYAPIDFDVIDSLAFADLTGEEIRLLLLVVRQWNGKNNGQLQATFSFCKRRGVRSQTTLQKSIASLISHGLLVRTRGHGISMVDGKNIPAKYAITWRPLCDKQHRTGLFVHGFIKNAYQKWKPDKKGGSISGGTVLQILENQGHESPKRGAGMGTKKWRL